MGDFIDLEEQKHRRFAQQMDIAIQPSFLDIGAHTLLLMAERGRAGMLAALREEYAEALRTYLVDNESGFVFPWITYIRLHVAAMRCALAVRLIPGLAQHYERSSVPLWFERLTLREIRALGTMYQGTNGLFGQSIPQLEKGGQETFRRVIRSWRTRRHEKTRAKS